MFKRISRKKKDTSFGDPYLIFDELDHIDVCKACLEVITECSVLFVACLEVTSGFIACLELV